MARHEKIARSMLRILGVFSLLTGAVAAFIAFSGGIMEFTIGLLLASAYGWIGVGLYRAKESAWTVSMMVVGLTTAVQTAMLAATRDPLMTFGLAMNVAVIVALVWAGRQIPNGPVGAPMGEEIAA